MAELDVHEDVKRNAFTVKNYRDKYPAIDPSRPELAQTGKVVVITGGSRGLGRLVRPLYHKLTVSVSHQYYRPLQPRSLALEQPSLHSSAVLQVAWRKLRSVSTG